MSGPVFTAWIEGIGFWTQGLPSWADAQAYARGGMLPADAATRPSPQLLAPNERRRAPETVAVALEVALAACAQAGRDPATLPSVFTSVHGDLTITDYICATLADAPQSVSPTRFHNSVHNAAAGYWTIGAGCMRPATAISAFDASYAQGLIEAMVQLASGSEAVLLVGYDGSSAGPLSTVSPSRGLLGTGLVLSSTPRANALTLSITLVDGDGDADDGDGDGAIAQLARGNAMAPMLPLFDAIASGATQALLRAGPGRALRVELGR